ncbi:Down syndrome cell adhesion molecule 4 isoform X2 [Oratosquilla oratoria]|uniref:Down syndrome cell adhesion molecule 4 isoform X2 n=1 Tax=Oratosquilla oratoria TaxID=337810 RepID=UPI003F76E165
MGVVQEGPQFVVEPPTTLTFLNTTGAALHCHAHGNPTPAISWVVGETGLMAAMPITGIREVLTNGSLVFMPFDPSSYRQDVHATSYRCLASSSVGAIVSRTVTVRAVVRQDYEVQVYDEYVVSGNTAILSCRIPPYVREYVRVVAWIQDSSLVIKPGLQSAGTGKYVILPDGSLHIYRADPSDGYRTYRCRTNHTLTGDIRDSSSGRVVITEPHENGIPRLSVDKRITVTARAGESALLPCAAQAHPTPFYRWVRVGEGVMSNVVGVGSSKYTQVGGLLLVSGVGVGDKGRYMCFVNNSVGHETVEVTLLVTEPLSVHVSPVRVVVDMGKSAVFRCVVHGHPVASLVWLHNGRLLPPDPRFRSSSRETLEVAGVGKDDRGMYQCVASSKYDVAQAAAQLTLGDSSPELLYRFQQQTLQPGPSVSLKCVATGNPPPQFVWTLDGFPLPESDRFLVGQYVTVHDDVISHVNISNVRVEDGGEYECAASNSVGTVHHSAKVNVYGLPFIRPMSKVAAVAGKDLVIKCPVAGYPIESIIWEKEGRVLPINIRQTAYKNGTLVISQTQRVVDEGRYTCKASNRHGNTVDRDVIVQVTVPPKIMPFAFANKILSEGNRASLTCQILEGDLPVTFRWEKDLGPLPLYEGITTRLLDDYSTQLVIERISSRHNGEYSCLATNQAGTRSYAAKLTVNVPPHWVTEPQDTAAEQGSSVQLHCQADGFPAPKITWRKASGPGPGNYRELSLGSGAESFANGTVAFRKVEKSAEGQYLCQARNGIGAGLSTVVLLTVNAPPHFAEKQGRVVVRLGETARLRCAAKGDLPIDIFWSVEGRRLDPHAEPSFSLHHSRRMEVREELAEGGLVSELVILSSARSHSATYACQAANLFGRDLTSIKLVVQEVPEQPKNLRVLDAQSRQVKLSWTAPYSGNTQIQNYVIQYKLASEAWPSVPDQLSVPGEQSEGVITELSPASAYHLRVTAQNALGLGTPSEVIQATTEEEEPSGPPQDIRITPESSTSLRVTWEPPLRNQWNGNILGYYVGFRAHDVVTDFNFQTVEVGSAYGGSTLLTGLEQYTRYDVVVQAFNNRGTGPLSKPTVATTLEDAPSLPPETIRCEATTPQSVSVAWRPPPVRGQNGLIQGYRILYFPLEDNNGNMASLRVPAALPTDGEVQTQTTAAESTNLFNLLKYTNYSIRVLAYTSAGDGVTSQPIFCRTKQDVPDSPAGIKAVVSSPDTLLVTWQPPKNINGVLTKYTLHMAVKSDGDWKELPTRTLGPDEVTYLADGVSVREMYQFWVTSSTEPGEGPPTQKITVQPFHKVSAQIASFGGPLEVAWKEDVRLQCHSVGDPKPGITWMFNGAKVKAGDKIQILPNGSLLVRDVGITNAGNWTCSALNPHGADSITYTLSVQVPPRPPTLYVQGSSRDSITLRWSLDAQDSPVRGYIINYKREYGDWEEVQLNTVKTSHTLSGLVCGSKYQLYVTAYNKVGTGLPSKILTASTKGSEPVVPSRSRLLDVNSTSVLVHLSTWGDGGCPILYYVIEYRKEGFGKWLSVSNNVGTSEKTYVVRDLQPASRYTIRVTAHNHAGSSLATYDISTLTHEGDVVTDSTGTVGVGAAPPIYQDARVLVPSVISIIILVLILVAGCVYRRRKLTGQGDPKPGEMGESPSTAQIQNLQNQHNQQYSVLPTATPSTQDTSTYKADSSDYIEDICPYATFQLPAVGKSHYGESTDSGIVYSGPYHSVQGAFVYHDPKMSSMESFPLRHVAEKQKEPEYTKVRRKGRRDPHVESTESDNLGSTDSEVKKILSLHMPISEYDTLGSDSEEPPMRESPPTFAESTSHPHAHIHAHPHLHGGRLSSRPESVVSQQPRASTDIFKHRVRNRQQDPCRSQENSSSSTDTSSSGRRSHPRRGKKAGKRPSRSASRTSYEETSFSHGSGERILPPPRFLDGREHSEAECDIEAKRIGGGGGGGGSRRSSSVGGGIGGGGGGTAASTSSSSTAGGGGGGGRYNMPQKYYRGVRSRHTSYQINV